MQTVPEEILRGRAELELKIKGLKETLQFTEEQLRAFDLVIQTIKHGEQDVAQARPSIAVGQKFEKMGLEEACLIVFKEAEEPLYREEVADVLLNGGYSTKSNNFKNVVGATLYNLHKTGRIHRLEEISGRVQYGHMELGKELINKGDLEGGNREVALE